MIDLSGKTALITGGGRGIGKAITETLVRAGAFVYCTYKDDPDSAWKLAAQLTSPTPPNVRVLPLCCDITQQSDCEELRRVIELDREALDILVLNAGINRPAPLPDITLEDWQTVIDTNLTGAFLLVQALLPVVRDGGSIIFIGSSSAFTGGPISTHYSASKSGLIALAQNVALYAAPRQIRSNLVAPGYIQSEMASGAAQNPKVQDMIDRIPMGRLGRAEEVAGAVLWLASDWAGYVTGTVIHVSGGLVW